MSRHDWGDILFLIFLLALVMILVRPNSKAPVFITALGDAMTAILKFAADGGQGPLSSGLNAGASGASGVSGGTTLV